MKLATDTEKKKPTYTTGYSQGVYLTHIPNSLELQSKSQLITF